MATRPTERILDWASAGTNTDPGAGVEATGWEVDDRPPAYWWNFILNSFGKWLSYFDETVAPVLTYGGCSFAGSSPGTVHADSVNIASVTATSTIISCNFTTAYPQNDYFVQVTGFDATADHFYVINTKFTDKVHLKVYDLSTGLIVDASTETTAFDIVIHGESL